MRREINPDTVQPHNYLQVKRRNFIKTSLAAGATLAVPNFFDPAAGRGDLDLIFAMQSQLICRRSRQSIFARRHATSRWDARGKEPVQRVFDPVCAAASPVSCRKTFFTGTSGFTCAMGFSPFIARMRFFTAQVA